MDKKRIIFTALVGTIALAALSVSISLAWYGASDRLRVSSLDVSMFTEQKLKISTSDDLNSFKDSLTMLDFDEEDRNIVFTPTSTMFQSQWYNPSAEQRAEKPSFYDIYNGSYLSSSQDVRPQESMYGFFTKDLYLITNYNFYASLEVDTNPEKNGSSFSNNDEANRRRAEVLQRDNPDWNLSVDEIKAKLDNLINCLRISILVLDENEYHYYIIDPTKEATDTTYYGGRLDNNGDGYYDTYRAEVDDEFVDTEVLYGEVNDRSKIVYNPASESGDSSDSNNNDSHKPEFFSNSFVAESKPSARTYNETASKANGFEIAEEKSLSLEEIKTAQNNPSSSQENKDRSVLIPCHSNVPSHIVLSIYLEGWDTDCINATMGASFDIKLSFKLLRGID